jgi:hypothetical protein
MRMMKRVVVPFDGKTIGNNNCNGSDRLPQHESKLKTASTPERPQRRIRRISGLSLFLVSLQEQSTPCFRMSLMLVVVCVSSVFAFLVQQQQEYALINMSSGSHLDWQTLMHQQLLRNEKQDA